jgi:hypothetical protein
MMMKTKNFSHRKNINKDKRNWEPGKEVLFKEKEMEN